MGEHTPRNQTPRDARSSNTDLEKYVLPNTRMHETLGRPGVRGASANPDLPSCLDKGLRGAV